MFRQRNKNPRKIFNKSNLRPKRIPPNSNQQHQIIEKLSLQTLLVQNFEESQRIFSSNLIELSSRTCHLSQRQSLITICIAIRQVLNEEIYQQTTSSKSQQTSSTVQRAEDEIKSSFRNKVQVTTERT